MHSFSQAAVDKALERLRERYRARFPTERLILCVDQRADSPFAFHVLAVERSSPWYDFMPAEQLVEIRDERPGE